MRKMKRLIKAREHFIPWKHWANISILINGISIVALFISTYLAKNINSLIPWFIFCSIHLAVYFIVKFISYFLSKQLAKNTLDILTKKLVEGGANITKIHFNITKFTLYSCTIEAFSDYYTTNKLEQLFSEVPHNFNRKFSNSFYLGLTLFSSKE